MGVMERRRALIGMQTGGKLCYWLCGQDAPILNTNKYYWRCRTFNGVKPIAFELMKNSSNTDANLLWNEQEGYYVFGEHATNYAYANINTDELTLGNHWRVEFDIDFNSYGSNSCFLDLGSVTSAAHAIGFSIGISPNTMGINWKMKGNTSNPGTYITENFDLFFPTDGYERFVGSFSIIDGEDGYDQFVAELNGAKMVCPAKIPQAFYGPEWNRYLGYIGRGMLSTSYNSNVRIRDIKIYRID